MYKDKKNDNIPLLYSFQIKKTQTDGTGSLLVANNRLTIKNTKRRNLSHIASK